MDYIVNRVVTKAECPWLDEDVKAATRVYGYSGYTYGVISPSGTACTMSPDETPFFELPTDALTKDHPNAG